jgi:hypothetical protein
MSFQIVWVAPARAARVQQMIAVRCNRCTNWFLFTSVFSSVLFGISLGQVMKELYGNIFNKPAV